MNEQEALELAEAHWKWLESLLHKIYVDAMVHGIKHGQEQLKSQESSQSRGRE